MRRWNNRRMPWWSQLLIGIVMLGIAGGYGLISMANAVGFSQAGIKVVIGLGSVAWIITGVVFVIRGLNKM